ncbi:MAG TPA: magnesium/cobalt transporter CorA [Rubrobacteraceae bacterium]|nr:magnesium/cobalt transporter CorA [Rubrobacteraceae bacterium]
MITSFYRSPDGDVRRDLSPEEMTRALERPGGLLWVDLEGPEPEQARSLLDGVFSFHHLAVDDCLNPHVDPPKIDDYGQYLFIISQGIRFHARSERLETTELDIFLGPNYVVSFHSHHLAAVDDVRQRATEEGPLAGRSPDLLVHALLDALVDQFQPVVAEMDQAVDALEEAVLANPQQRLLHDMLLLKRNAQRLRRTLLPQRDAVNRFARGEFPRLVSEETHIYFRDIYDHVVRVEDMVESLRDLTESVLGTYLSAVNNRMNEVMKVLSIVATIILPLTLISGIYGTNFENLPELGWQWGYFGMLGAMAVIALGLVAFFRWRKWF